MSKNLVECNTSTVPWFIALASTPTRYPRAGRGADGQARRVGSLLAALALGQQLWSFRHLPSVPPSSARVQVLYSAWLTNIRANQDQPSAVQL